MRSIMKYEGSLLVSKGMEESSQSYHEPVIGAAEDYAESYVEEGKDLNELSEVVEVAGFEESFFLHFFL